MSKIQKINNYYTRFGFISNSKQCEKYGSLDYKNDNRENQIIPKLLTKNPSRTVSTAFHERQRFDDLLVISVLLNGDVEWRARNVEAAP